MKVLVIDNYDSFTYNLCHLVAQVTGTFPITRLNDQLTMQALAELAPDAVILSPGPGHPAKPRDFGVCAQILQSLAIPVLGVCLGHQGIAHFSGATVQLANRPVHGLASRIRHCGQGLFHAIPQHFQAVRYHSFIVFDPLPEQLEAIAWTSDGDEIMALRHRGKPFWGVQFHPESIATEHGASLLANFFREALRLPRTTLIPVEGTCSAEQAYADLFAQDEYSFWLDSSLTHPENASFSYLGSSGIPGSYLVSYRTESCQLTVGGEQRTQKLFEFLRQELQSQPLLPTEPGFAGGFVGYLGFELKSECGFSRLHRSALPDAQLLFAPALLAFDHQQERAFCVLTNNSPELHAWAASIQQRLLSLAPNLEPPGRLQMPSFSPRLTPEIYRERVRAAQREIQLGESYEVCLTDLLTASRVDDPFTFYRHLRRRNPAPYSAFLKFGQTAIACSSPERFLRVQPDRQVTSKPIKGTAARGLTQAQDEKNKAALLHSEKDGAEHLMIVDLVRHDLGRVCEPRSVHVPSFRAIESYASVHHLVSTVQGTLRPDCSVIDAIEAAFPPGSMTGAPKARTLEILDRLEAGPRGIYSGAIGWIGSNNCCDLNVVIRTAVMTPDATKIGSGGAIVAASDPGLELEELRLKISPLVDWDD